MVTEGVSVIPKMTTSCGTIFNVTNLLQPACMSDSFVNPILRMVS